jgi:ribosomal protein S18 acetylase RimI-like enzyme
MDAHRLGPPPGLGQSRGDGSNNNKNNCAAILPQPPPLPPLHLGPLTPAHRPALEAHHAALFPVDYEPAFYDAVMTNTDGVFSFGLFAGEEGGAPTSQPSPALAGFVTARAVPWAELAGDDLRVLELALPPGFTSRDGRRGPDTARGGGGGGPPLASPVAAVYVLTLGVPATAHRRAGAGRALMGAVSARAAGLGAGCVYLHVAAFNGAAAAFYASLGKATPFPGSAAGGGGGGGGGGGRPPPPPAPAPPPYRLVATLPAFYSIPARPPVPGVTRYDAHLLVRRVGAGEEEAGRGGDWERHPPARHHLPAWRARSALASPPLAPPLPPAPGEVAAGVATAALPPAHHPLAALLAAWARAAWGALPPAPAWARGLFGGREAGEMEARHRDDGQRRAPAVLGDII